MPTPGQVLFWPHYKFTNNTIANKLFIILNDSSRNNDLCLMLSTTSQEKWYLNYTEGCNRNLNCFHIPKSWHECLDKPTFVVLPLIIEYECQKIWEMYNYGVKILPKSLTSDCMAKIKACLANYIDDIAPRHKSSIF